MNTISARRLFITILPAVSILAAITAVCLIYRVDMSRITRDVTSIAKIHPLSGVLSNLGILLWCATASICLFAALTLRDVKSKEIFWFLLSSALLSMYLLFDDFFLFHDALALMYLGLNEKVVIAVLGVAVSTYLIAFRRVILRTDYDFLLLALGLLASSVIIDMFQDEQWMLQLGQWSFFFEDGAKWLGIASWCSYFVRTSFQLFVNSLGLPDITIKSDARASPLMATLGAAILLFVLLASLTVVSILASRQLYQVRSRDMGITAFDVVVTENRREPRLSVLSITGAKGSSSAASRWIMCSFTDLAIKRGFRFWAAIYFPQPRAEVFLGFPENESEDLRNVFGKEIVKETVVHGSVDHIGKLCGIPVPPAK